jgi:hypothetical protein
MNIRAEIFGERSERRLIKVKPANRPESKGLSDIVIAREERRRTNSRDQDRFRLTGAAFKLTYEGADYDAEVVNLSGGGAMIGVDLAPNLGDRLHLHLGADGSIECVVRWIRDGRLGLEFAHETQLDCPEDELASLLREVIRRDFPEQKFAGRRGQRPKPGPEALEPELRRAIRHPLIWWGDLHHGSHSWHVRLRNISATGALIDCPGELRIDSEILLELGNAVAVTGSVSWSVGDHVGLKFDQPFDLRRLSEAKPKIMAPSWVRPAYLEAQVEPDSPWDRSWNRMSVDDLRSQLEGFLKR